MFNIKILDCTLRDGGYVNDWDFGRNISRSLLSLLIQANIDYVEAGFLSCKNTNIDKTLFNTIEEVYDIFPEKTAANKLLLMIKTGEYDIEKLPEAINANIGGLRLIFKKHQLHHGIEIAEKLIKKGYKLFVNPTFCNQYNKDEFLKLIEMINELQPFAFTIVDSIGSLDSDNTLKLFNLFNENLRQDIAICFHFHNNMQLSYSNACLLSRLNSNREIIVDTTLYGMGRGAGNLCTELFVQHLNTQWNTKYNIIPILDSINNYILPIYDKTPWGYTLPYFLSAKNGCHPNYAKFLSENTNLSYAQMSTLLKAIPQEYKTVYNEKYIITLFSSMMK